MQSDSCPGPEAEPRWIYGYYVTLQRVRRSAHWERGWCYVLEITDGYGDVLQYGRKNLFKDAEEAFTYAGRLILLRDAWPHDALPFVDDGGDLASDEAC